MSKRALAILVLVIGACSGQSRRLLHPTDPATDFHQVSEGIYRGGRLEQHGVVALKQMGFKTILNLENDGGEIAQEAVWAKAAGVVQISQPMSGFRTPSDRQVDTILAILADPANRPIYVHCKKGMDRTGIVIALHRVYNEGWTVARAEHERDVLGFNSYLQYLDRYWVWKGGRYKTAKRLLVDGSSPVIKSTTPLVKATTPLVKATSSAGAATVGSARAAM